MNILLVGFILVMCIQFPVSAIGNKSGYTTDPQNITWQNDVDYTRQAIGLEDVLQNGTTTQKLKLVIQHNDTKYIYDLKNLKAYVSFPLQMGNGAYSSKIYENTTGTKYKVLYTGDGNVQVDSANQIYLNSIQVIDWNAKKSAIILAQKLIDDATKIKRTKLGAPQMKLTQKEKISVLYKYVISNYDYDYDKIKTLSSDYIPDIDQILKDKKGICFDYSVLLAAMMRSQGIPTKLIKGYSSFTDVYHAWNEVYLESEKRWAIVDTTYDAYMYDHKKSYTFEKKMADYTKNLEY